MNDKRQTTNSYPGGKAGSGIYQKIINHIPPHQIYIEPFLGGGAIMRKKLPADQSIGIDIDHDVVDRFTASIPGLVCLCQDGIKWLIDHQHDINFRLMHTFIYCDPPYLMDTRKQQRDVYRYEMSNNDHLRFLDVITRMSYCSIAISGYASSMYREALSGWRLITFQAKTRGNSMATEHLWLNYPEPFELHDYRYLGENYRERERIKRKQSRWINRLQTMPAQERYAMLDSINQLRSQTPADITLLANNISYDVTAVSSILEISDPTADYDDNCRQASSFMVGAARATTHIDSDTTR